MNTTACFTRHLRNLPELTNAPPQKQIVYWNMMRYFFHKKICAGSEFKRKGTSVNTFYLAVMNERYLPKVNNRAMKQVQGVRITLLQRQGVLATL